MRRFLLGFLAISAILTGCGPEEKAEQRQREELTDRYRREYEKALPVLGQYEGQMVSGAKTVFPMNLAFYEGKTTRPAPGGGEPIAVPIVIGRAIATLRGHPERSVLDFFIDSVTYDPASHSLNFSSASAGSSSQVAAVFNGRFSEGVIEGLLQVNGQVNEVKVKRVTP